MKFAQSQSSHRSARESTFLALVTLCALLVLPLFNLLPAQTVLAQPAAQENGGWSQPVNLSKSGSATNPAMLLTGPTWNVVWYDTFAGSRFTSLEEGGAWKDAATVNYPFQDNLPRLMQGPDGLSFAFWIDTRGMLNSSRARNIGDRNAWEPRRQITMNTVAYDVTLDSQGIMHLVYVTNVDALNKPAGVYYRKGLPGGSGWAADVQLYSSPYFRGIEADEVGASAAVIPGAETSTILIGWNDPALGKVLLKQSSDDAKTWGEAEEIDFPGSSLGSALPFGLDIATWKDRVILVWKKRTSETTCTTVYQISNGAGGWSAPQNMLGDFTGCPSNDGFLGQSSDLLLYHMQVNNQLILAAWDGSRWSKPQAQSDLTGFKDSVTGRSLTMGCLQLAYQPEQNMLYAVGCDVEGNQDIWASSRKLGKIESWFPPPSAWDPPQELMQSAGTIHSINLLAGAKGNFHAVWAQPPLTSTNATRAVVHYASWDGERWSVPGIVLGTRGSSVNQLSAAVSEIGEVLVTWRADAGCTIYFSHALADSAFSASEWARAVTIPPAAGTCSAPSIIAGEREEVYLAYAVPVNEGRGIYLTSSADGGQTWGEPALVFDAQAAGWEMIDQPRLVMSGGRMHLLWLRGTLLQPDAGLGLGYAYSDDGGASWSTPDLSVEAPLSWASLAASTNGQLIRVWQQQGGDQPAIVTQTSADNGETWSSALSVTSFGKILGKPAIVADSAGAFHLVQVNQDYLGQVVLRHWIWYNDTWSAGESMDLNGNTVQSISSMAAAFVETGKIAVLYAADGETGENQSLRAVLGSADQQAEGLPAAPNTPTPAPETTTLPSASPTPASTSAAAVEETLPAATPQVPTPTISTQATTVKLPEDLSSGPAETESWTGVILSVGLAVLVVVGVFGYRIVKPRS